MLSERLRRIDAYNEDGQGGSQGNENNADQQVWLMKESIEMVTAHQDINTEFQVQSKMASLKDTHTSSVAPSAENNQDGKEFDDAGIINSQESVLIDDGQNGSWMGEMVKNFEGMKMVVDADMNNDKVQVDGPSKMPQEERRSEHLKGGIHLTTMDKNVAMSKKCNLEGNSKKTYALADIDNHVLNNLAKDMGVLVKDSNFDSFDMLKELENARNCLNKC